MSASPTVHPLKIVAIGNSRGVRLPRALLRRYGMADHVTLEERPEGLLLRGSVSAKTSLKQTFTEMAREQTTGAEDWSDLDALASDGLGKLTW
jgi:antitoxin MazE